MISFSLKDILDAREERWLRRLELSKRGALLTLTLNIPGPDKNPPRWNEVHELAAGEIKDALKGHIIYIDERKTPGGLESHFVTDMSPLELKRYAVSFEENHPIGRLLDADVMDGKGNQIDRKSLGLSSRRCLCCDKEAKVCSREKRHSIEEIFSRAEHMISKLDSARDAKTRETALRRY
ncbi:putative apo-citrate lyase phosphoribosyl-dephospho-CoA transferase [Synergistales bacterium]|nr:putative apo-citrate lyase phosphoribosyl-dephospho-CoA transferase [Synergistales bacterium]